MWRILPGLFLGTREAAENRERLQRAGITHIVNCSKELPCPFPEEFVYLPLRMDDPDPSFAAKMPDCCAFIDRGRREGKVLVHCTGAVSRSPAVILAYLCHQGDSLEQAAQRLSRIVQTCPDELFLEQLNRLQGGEMSADGLEALTLVLLGRV